MSTHSLSFLHQMKKKRNQMEINQRETGSYQPAPDGGVSLATLNYSKSHAVRVNHFKQLSLCYFTPHTCLSLHLPALQDLCNHRVRNALYLLLILNLWLIGMNCSCCFTRKGPLCLADSILGHSACRVNWPPTDPLHCKAATCSVSSYCLNVYFQNCTTQSASMASSAP